MITIVDYGLGNLSSIQNMLRRIGVKSQISSVIDEIEQAKKIILPGVGAFDYAMEQIESKGLKNILTQKAKVNKVPFLGICLGMQLLTNQSEEGSRQGLGFIEAETKKINANVLNLKVPHMGWNEIQIVNENRILENLPKDPRFYFVHSYYVSCRKQVNVLATTNYGAHFASIIHNENIYGAQFHPEKSHKFGMKFLENFSNL